MYLVILGTYCGLGSNSGIDRLRDVLEASRVSGRMPNSGTGHIARMIICGTPPVRFDSIAIMFVNILRCFDVSVQFGLTG